MQDPRHLWLSKSAYVQHFSVPHILMVLFTLYQMMSLAVDILRLITGRVHIQVNPRQAFDQITIEESVLRLRDHFRRFEPRSNPDEDLSRVCFKIPSTWEGLMACRSLEAQGISTLATTVFSVSQAVLAAEVGCAYVAPYLHALGEDFQK